MARQGVGHPLLQEATVLDPETLFTEIDELVQEEVRGCLELAFFSSAGGTCVSLRGGLPRPAPSSSTDAPDGSRSVTRV